MKIVLSSVILCNTGSWYYVISILSLTHVERCVKPVLYQIYFHGELDKF